MPKPTAPLTIEQLILAGVRSYDNAIDLAKDAEILFVNQRWARTLFLCCIANEELGKCFLSLVAAMRVRVGEFDEAKRQQYLKRFYCHRQKTRALDAIVTFYASDRTMADIVQKTTTGDQAIADIELIKLSSLYTDFDEDGVLYPGGWFATQDKVEFVLNTSKRGIEKFRDEWLPMFDRLTLCEIEECRIWIKQFDDFI